MKHKVYNRERHDMILRYIVDYSNENGFGPSLREIMKHIGINSMATMRGYLLRMKENGYINYQPLIKRSIVMTAVGMEYLREAEYAIRSIEGG